MKLKYLGYLAFGFGALSASAASLSCTHEETITQEEHEDSDYIVDYDIIGTIEADQASIKVTSTEYYLKKEGDTWVRGKKGNIHTEVDRRSNFKWKKKNGTYNVYTSSYKSDRTGAFTYNLAFILDGEVKKGTAPTATYSKSTSTDDMPFHEHVPVKCKIE